MDYITAKRRRGLLVTLGTALVSFIVMAICFFSLDPETLENVRSGMLIIAVSNIISTAGTFMVVFMEIKAKEDPI